MPRASGAPRSTAGTRASEGAGRAEAADIYAAAYNRDPEFYRFLKSMGTLEESFDADTVFLLSTESELLRYLNGTR